MTSSQSAPRTVFIMALAALALFAFVGQPALACPEITLDPTTGVAISQPDLEAALAELSARKLVSIVDASG
jgi:hypothetical protein